MLHVLGSLCSDFPPHRPDEAVKLELRTWIGVNELAGFLQITPCIS